MSLVNKMLRDLDARRVGDSDRAAFPAAVTPLAARQEPRGMPWLWLATALAAVVLGAAAWYATRKPDVPAAVFAAAVPAVPQTPVVSTAPAAPVAPVAPVAPTASAASAASVAPTASAASVATGAARPARTGAPVPLAKAALPNLRLADKLSAAPAVAAAEPLRKAPAPELPAASTAPPRPPVVTLAKVPPLPGEARIDKQVRLPSAADRAETEYRRGVLAHRQGNAEDAAGSYRAALEEFPEYAAARQTLAALLIEAKRFDEAEELLLKGTELVPVRLPSTLALARLKVERDQVSAALELLQKNAASGERSAEYQGFAGALLNRAGRAPEAVERYQAATRLAPSEGRWWAGLGMALDASGNGSEAREAYQKARALPGLPADLAQHIEQRLR